MEQEEDGVVLWGFDASRGLSHPLIVGWFQKPVTQDSYQVKLKFLMEKGQACKQRRSTHGSDVMFSREGALYGNCSVKITAEEAQDAKLAGGISA